LTASPGSRALQDRQAFDWQRVALVPFPRDHRSDLWSWLLQYPQYNFDDEAPQTQEAFELFFPLLSAHRRELWGVEIDGQLLGAMGFETLSPGLAVLRGIVFNRSTHGSGAPLAAVRLLLDQAWRLGYRKVEAQMLAPNGRVYAFLKKLGAEDEGTRRAAVLQHGKPVDMRLVAFFAPGSPFRPVERT
jgi:RimJ/RimL family protein N-acetyltransferase